MLIERRFLHPRNKGLNGKTEKLSATNTENDYAIDKYYFVNN